MSTAMEGPTGAAPRLTPPPPLTLANPTSPREASPSPAPLPSVAGNTLRPTLSPSSLGPPHGLPLPPAHGSMFPFFKADKPVYNCSPQAASCPENNNCKLIEFRGAKLASFKVDGRELICLPQAFDLFLKHLVGGLHTVYTKLKRLDITPVVCNVEQVRVLRGLGAIQPGVNRCKLIAPKEFDVLYDDCTNASSRPGRPPKRSSIMSSPDSLEKLKKSRMEDADFSHMAYPHNKLIEMKKSALFTNGYHYPPQMPPLPFLPLGHPAMMNLAMANHLGGMRPEHMMPLSQAPNGLDLTRTKDRIEPEHIREKDGSAMPKPLNLEVHKPPNGHLDKEPPALHPHHPSLMSAHSMDTNDRRSHMQESINNNNDADDEDDEYDSYDASDDDDSRMKGALGAIGSSRPSSDQPKMADDSSADKTALAAMSGSSLETLLLNILGLLKVAAQNARNWEQQISAEKAELTMRAAQEREARDRIEKQLHEEQKLQAILQKKLKRERKMIKRLRHQLQMQTEPSHAELMSRSSHLDVKEEVAPKLNRMPMDDPNSDGEQSSCSSDVPSPSENWRTQPAFPRPIAAPMNSDPGHPPYSMEVPGLRASLKTDGETGSYMMASSQKVPSDSPENTSVSSS